jgi:hypothetical protein
VIESRWEGEIFRPSRPTLGPIEPYVQWVPGISRGKERPGRAADHSFPSSAEVLEGYSYTSTHLWVTTGPVMGLITHCGTCIILAFRSTRGGS